jgi:type I restriction enzyme S subunit
MKTFLKLADHCEKIGSGSTPRGGHKSYVPIGIPLIRSQNVLMRSFTRDGLAFITQRTHEEMAGTEVSPGDVLLNITGASIGRVCVVPDDVCPANVNQHVCIVRCGRRIVPQFLMLYLSSPAFQKLIDDTQAGGTRQALTKADIEDFEIPELDVDTQRDLAAALIAQLREIDTARHATEQQLADLLIMPDKLLQSALKF